MTMNNLDRSTEDLDDAILGRVSAVEFPPRVEDLHELLKAAGVVEATSTAIRELFAKIQAVYPLGHGYFADFRNETKPIPFYLARIRPVLQSHLSGYRGTELSDIDEKVDQLFGGKPD
jgi:hypothetical protein